MTALSHLDTNFGSVFAIQAANEPMRDASRTPGYGDCTHTFHQFQCFSSVAHVFTTPVLKNFVRTIRVMESILGVGPNATSLPLNTTLLSTNFTGLAMVLSDSPQLNPQVRQAIRDAGPILLELSPSLGFGLPTGAPSTPLVMREPLVTKYVSSLRVSKGIANCARIASWTSTGSTTTPRTPPTQPMALLATTSTCTTVMVYVLILMCRTVSPSVTRVLTTRLS